MLEQIAPDPQSVLLKELQENNDLLLRNLHLAQEELEKYYLRNQDLEKSSIPSEKLSTKSTGWIAEEFPKILAENQRL